MKNKEDKKNKILTEEEKEAQLDAEFDRIVQMLPHITILPAEWDNPEDDIYSEVYGSLAKKHQGRGE